MNIQFQFATHVNLFLGEIVPLVKKERFEEAYKIVAELRKSQIWAFYRLDDFYKTFLNKDEMERCGLLC